jgi:hypothetical protein
LYYFGHLSPGQPRAGGSVWRARRWCQAKEESSSFLKKRSKRLLFSWLRDGGKLRGPGQAFAEGGNQRVSAGELSKPEAAHCLVRAEAGARRGRFAQKGKSYCQANDNFRTGQAAECIPPPEAAHKAAPKE